MGEQGRNQGTISEPQFREFMQQIMILKESSLIREAENKENRRLHGLHHQQGKFPPQGLLGPPPDMEVDGKPPSLLAMPPLERPLDNGPPVPPTSTRSPHKNDLPMADPVMLQEIENDPTKTLNIDDIPRTIRYYISWSVGMQSHTTVNLGIMVRLRPSCWRTTRSANCLSRRSMKPAGLLSMTQSLLFTRWSIILISTSH